MSEARVRPEDTVVTRIHRETRESLEKVDEQLAKLDSKVLELRRQLRTRPSDSQRALLAVIAAGAKR